MSGGGDPKDPKKDLPAENEDDWLAAIDEWGSNLGEIITDDTAKTAPAAPEIPIEAPKPQVFYRPEPVADASDPDRTRVAALTPAQRAMLSSPAFPQELIPTKVGDEPEPGLEIEPTVRTTAGAPPDEPTVKTAFAPARPTSSPGRALPAPPARPTTSPGRAAPLRPTERPSSPPSPAPHPPSPRVAPPRPRTGPTMPAKMVPPPPERPRFLAEPPATIPGTGSTATPRPAHEPRPRPASTPFPLVKPRATLPEPPLFGDGAVGPLDTTESPAPTALPDYDDLEVGATPLPSGAEVGAFADAEEQVVDEGWGDASTGGFDDEEVIISGGRPSLARETRAARHEHAFDALPDRPHEYWTARSQLLEGQLPHAGSDLAAARILLEMARIHERKLAAPQRAASAYAQARAKAPGWLAPIEGLIRLAEDAGRWDEVDGLLEEALGLDLAEDERLELLLLRAEIALSTRRDEERASRALAQAAKIAPADPEVALALGEIAFARGNADDLTDRLRPFADATGPGAAGLALLEGARFERAGDPVVALDRYRSALAADPSLSGALVAMERSALAADDRATAGEARQRLARALEGAPEAAAWQYRAARLAHLVEGRAADAMQALAALPPTRARRAALLSAASATGDVEATVQAGTALASDLRGVAAAVPLVTVGLALRRAGRNEEALATLGRAATEAPDLGPAVWAEEEMLRSLGQFQRTAERYAVFGEDSSAAAIFEHAGMSADASALLDRLVDDPAARGLVDALEVDRGDWARVCLRRADQIARGGPVASMVARLEALASSQAGRLGDTSGAEETLRRVRELAPDDPLTETLPILVVAADDASRAAAARQEASRVDDDARAADALVREGWARETLGEAEAATRAFEEALARRPAHPFAAAALGRLRWASADAAGAAALARTGPQGAADLVLAARAEWDLDPQMAASDLLAAIGALGDSAELALRRLAASRAPAGVARAEIVEATAQATPVSDPSGLGAALVQAAEALEEADEHVRAVAAWRRAEAVAPGDPAVASALERALERTGGVAALLERRRADVASEEPWRRAIGTQRLLDLEERIRRDAEAAGQALSQLAELRPEDLPVLRALLRRHLAANRLDDAATTYARIARAIEGHGDVAPYCRRAAQLFDRMPDAAPFGSLELAVIAAETAPDPWALRYLEANARLDKEPHALTAVFSRLAETSEIPAERAAYGTREGDARREGGDATAAAAAYRKALEASADSVTALRALAALSSQLGDEAGAATALDAAAQASAVPAHVADMAYRAGRTWQDVVHDDRKALNSFARVLDADATTADAFERVMRILEATGRHDDAVVACMKRIGAGGDAETIAGLWRRIADQKVAADDRRGAKEALRSALGARMDDADTLRKLVELLLADRDTPEATSRLVELGALTTDPNEIRTVFFRLGALYEEAHEPKKAEESYRRVLSVEPTNLPTLERLSRLLVQQSDWPAALEVTTQLLHAATSPADRRPVRVVLCRIHEEGFKDLRAAEGQLEEGRREAPADLEAIGLLADFYRRHGAGPALGMHLDRAATDLRRVLAGSPFDEAATRALAQVLQWRGKPEGARAVREVLALCEHATAEERAAGHGLALQPRAADPAFDEIFVPAELPPALRELFKLVHETFDKALGAEPKTYGVGRGDRLPSKGTPVRDVATTIARAFGFPDVEIYLSQRDGKALVALPGSPPTVIVGRDLFGATDDDERAFLIARSLKLVQAHLAVPLLWPTDELGLWLSAVVKQFDPAYSGRGVDPAALEERTVRLAKLLPRKLRDPVMPFALECEGAQALDPVAIHAAAADLAERTALLVCGSVSASVGALRKMSGDFLKASSDAELVARAGAVPSIRRLLAFAVSDECFEARTRAAQAPT